jgi:beta-barrel assembly-enhancing protease
MRMRQIRFHKLTAQVTALLLVLIIAAPQLLAATEAVKFPPPHWTMFSREQETQLGQQAAQEVRKQYPVLPDSDPVSQYVRRLGQSLVQYVPEPRFPYEFHVVNQKEINAFALPGGPVFVNLGTVQAADNEAELVGVIAHEMSHVYERHGAAQASKEQGAQLGLGILGALLGRGVGAQVGQLAAAGLASGVFLHMSRSAESEADHDGALIMYLAGYNPQAMSDFFRKLEQEGGARGPQFLSDHPDPGNRAQAIATLIHSLPARSGWKQDSAQFREVKQEVTGRKALTAQEIAQMQKGGQLPNSDQGTIQQPSRSSVTPSGNMRTFDHQAFSIAYPDNWQVMGSQDSSVTIAPQAGVTQNAVAYGVIINGFQPESNDVDGAMHELEQSIRQSNPQMRLVGHDEAITVGGVQGRSVDMLGPSPITDSNGKAETERDWLVGLAAPNNTMVYLVFIAPDRDFGKLRPTFEQMLRSFRLK